MIRRPPRSTLFPYTTPLPISEEPGAAGDHRPPDLADVADRLDTTLHACGPTRRTGRQPLRRRSEIGRSTRLNSSHANISYAVFCLKKKKITVCPAFSIDVYPS